MDVRGYEPTEDSMALNISTNVPSLNAQRHLESSSSSLNKSLERLSSGLRINSAADDAAGLAHRRPAARRRAHRQPGGAQRQRRHQRDHHR